MGCEKYANECVKLMTWSRMTGLRILILAVGAATKLLGQTARERGTWPTTKK